MDKFCFSRLLLLATLRKKTDLRTEKYSEDRKEKKLKPKKNIYNIFSKFRLRVIILLVEKDETWKKKTYMTVKR